MRLSFLARQFLYGAGVLLVVLTAVTGLGWSRIVAFEGERVDDRLCMEARRLAAPLRPGDNAARLRADIAQKLRVDSEDRVMLQARGAGPAQPVQSPSWDPRMEEALPALAPRAPPARAGADPRGDCQLGQARLSSSDWRVARVQGPDGTGLLAVDAHAAHAELEGALTQALVLVVPMALLLAAVSSWLLASLGLRPVNRLREAMRHVTPQALDQRLPDQGEDREFRDLIAAYNTMLQRLETSFHHASRFSADAAHELKTPLTILRGRLEHAVAQAGPGPVQAELGLMLDEVGRLAGITRKLLLLSQADAGKLMLQREWVDLSTMLDDLVADLGMVLQGRPLHSEIQPAMRVRGDEVLLRQLLNNLVSNAARHGRPDGAVQVRAWAHGGDSGDVVVAVSNDCEPLQAAQRARLFERFYRADPAHGRQVEGSGLGLSLAREIARAHGGDLTLEPSAADVVSLRLRLPRG